jgi:hypothetical protein
MTTEFDILGLEPGDQNDHCRGPDSDGSCPRVGVGEVVPCAGCILQPASAGERRPYLVSRQATLCPVTLAQALAVPSDALFA